MRILKIRLALAENENSRFVCTTHVFLDLACRWWSYYSLVSINNCVNRGAVSAYRRGIEHSQRESIVTSSIGEQMSFTISNGSSTYLLETLVDVYLI